MSLMLDNVIIIKKTMWLISASKEMYFGLSNQFNRLVKLYPMIPKLHLSNINSSYIMSKKLFFEGKKLLENTDTKNIISPFMIDSINKRYFVRSISYLMDCYNLYLNIDSFCIGGSLYAEIRNDLKLLLRQNKSIADTLCLVK